MKAISMNPIDRCSLNSYVLKRGKLHTKDGKLVIYVPHDEPTEAKQRQNWLSTPKLALRGPPCLPGRLSRRWLHGYDLARRRRAGSGFKAVSPGLLPPLGIIFGLSVGFIAAKCSRSDAPKFRPTSYASPRS
jgi:hypothetical protein